MSRSLVAGGLVLLFLAAAPAAADEMWIAPSEKADFEVGTWGVTSGGDAHFTFAVPAALDGFVGAQVMVIGKRNRTITYELALSIAKDGEDHDTFTASATGLTAPIHVGELAALDASSVFPALAAGEDLVALHFTSTPFSDLQVVGLRFQYDRFPDHAGITCGAGLFLVGFEAETGAAVCKTLAEITGGGGGGGEGTLIEIDNVERVEGDAGTSPFVFTIALSAPHPTTVTVDFATVDGTATAASGDYVHVTGTVTFAPGDVLEQIIVLVNGDAVEEGDENFLVHLSNATGGASIGDDEGFGLIIDDEADGRD